MTVPADRWTLQDKIALVTGASRGIGAAAATKLAERGADVVITFRSKRARADEVAEAVRGTGRRALVLQADLTSDAEVAQMIQGVREEWGRIDVLVLNASGGLEKEKADTYAMDLNLHAQVRLVDSALPLMRPGSRIIFVTSHMAHFFGEKPSWPDYEPVAASKKAGEEALRKRLDQFTALGIKLVVVSGDLVDGTITPKLLDRMNRGVIEARVKQVGSIPTIDDFASAMAAVAEDPEIVSGKTVFVGSTVDYPV